MLLWATWSYFRFPSQIMHQLFRNKSSTTSTLQSYNISEIMTSTIITNRAIRAISLGGISHERQTKTTSTTSSRMDCSFCWAKSKRTYFPKRMSCRCFYRSNKAGHRIIIDTEHLYNHLICPGSNGTVCVIFDRFDEISRWPACMNPTACDSQILMFPFHFAANPCGI